MRRIRPLIPVVLAVAVATLLGGCVTPAESAPPWETLPPAQVSGVATTVENVNEAIERLPDLAQHVLDETGVPGLSVAVVRGGETVYAEGFGVREVGKAEPVNSDTVFALASLSKSISSTVISALIGEGVLAWDTPVVANLPGFAVSDDYVTQNVTVGDMFTQESGLPARAGDDLKDLGYTQDEIFERLRQLPMAPFRTLHQDTDFGLTAAAESAAAASGEDWADVARRTIYEPLKMTGTSSRYSDYISRQNRAVPHSWQDASFQVLEMSDTDAKAPAGGVSSTATDVARWMTMVLNGGELDGQQVVDADALLASTTPKSVNAPATTAGSRTGFSGYGFDLSDQPTGRTMISNSSAHTLGAGNTFRMLPSLGLGIVVLTNGAPIGAAEALTAQFTDIAQFGEVTRDWIAEYRGAFSEINAPSGELVGRSAPTNPAPTPDMTMLVGTYSNSYYGTVTVSEHAGSLQLTMGPNHTARPLTHWDGNTYTFVLRGETADAGTISQVVFTPNARGSELDAPADSMRIEYYNGNGLGMFTR